MCIKSTLSSSTTADKAIVPPQTTFKYEASQDIASVYHRMDVIDAKKPAKFGPVAFVASVLSVPIWATVLLPFTLLSSTINFLYYNLGKLFTSNITTVNDESSNGKQELSNTLNGEEIIVNITPRDERKYDLVLFGATGFVGRLAVSYLAKEYGINNDKVKWAVAGRSQAKIEATLSAIAQELGNDDIVNNVDVIIADTSDRSTLKGLVENTRSIASTVGPFQKYGSPLVEFCTKYGTHYADITGEVPWNKEMMRLHEHSAQQSGAKIVSFCGHDSIPWDLTVRYLSNKLREECNDELRQVECLDELVGGVSGGTLATVFESIDRTVKDFQWDSLWKKDDSLDMYQRLTCGSESDNKIVPDLPSTISKCRNPSQRFAGKWCGPFFMASINMEVSGRSVALSQGTKQTVKYREALVADNMMDAFVAWWGTILFGTAAINPVLLPILKQFLPSPGEGPTQSVLNDGFLCVSGYGIGENGNEVESAFYFPHDGGYKSTARMLVESSICLALDEDRHENTAGGFYSPASIMCDALLDRLVSTGSSFACSVCKYFK
ncbi:hypothetical protein ACHAWT_006674 [Skeletonema menzelii]